MIIQNAIWIPEVDKFLMSTSRHDCKTHIFDDGNVAGVDGGTDYIRTIGKKELWDEGRVVEYCLFTVSRPWKIQERLLWGHRGIKGDQPVEFRPIRSLTLDHLTAILRTQEVDRRYTKVITNTISHIKALR